jgi:hypothetical protein
VLAIFVCAGASPAAAAPKLPLRHAGRWITDATGRVVVMHGANLVYKVAPFYPSASPFGASDAAFLRSLEYGATSSAPSLDLMVSLADKYMVPWMYWSYCTCNDPTGSSDEGMVLDPSKPKTVANLRTSIVDAIVEPYPQVVAGTPVSWSFDRSTSKFTLRYRTARATRGSRRSASCHLPPSTR